MARSAQSSEHAPLLLRLSTDAARLAGREEVFRKRLPRPGHAKAWSLLNELAPWSLFGCDFLVTGILVVHFGLGSLLVRGYGQAA